MGAAAHTLKSTVFSTLSRPLLSLSFHTSEFYICGWTFINITPALNHIHIYYKSLPLCQIYIFSSWTFYLLEMWTFQLTFSVEKENCIDFSPAIAQSRLTRHWSAESTGHSWPWQFLMVLYWLIKPESKSVTAAASASGTLISTRQGRAIGRFGI